MIPHFDASTIPIVGGITVSGWSLLVMLGFLLGAELAKRKLRRDGLDPTLINRLLLWLVIGVFAGGHLGALLFYYPERFIANPAEIFIFRHGLSSYGGFFACTVLTVWFFRRENRKRRSGHSTDAPQLDFWAYADSIVYGLTLGWMIARIGCFVVHDHPGVPTSFLLGVRGICPGGQASDACHDLGLYDAILSLAMLALFVLLDRKPRYTGFFVAHGCIIYGTCRFALDFLRHPMVDARYAGLTPGHYGSIILVLIGFWVLRTRRGVSSSG